MSSKGSKKRNVQQKHKAKEKAKPKEKTVAKPKVEAVVVPKTEAVVQPWREEPPSRAVQVPLAMVSSRRDISMIERVGRGFSLGELAGAGLEPHGAARRHIQTDMRRRSALDANIQALKKWSASTGVATAQKPAMVVRPKAEEPPAQEPAKTEKAPKAEPKKPASRKKSK